MQRPNPSSMNHSDAAQHHDQAAYHHREAAYHHGTGNYETAAHHAQAARGHALNASDYANDASRHHSQYESGMMRGNQQNYQGPERSRYGRGEGSYRGGWSENQYGNDENEGEHFEPRASQLMQNEDEDEMGTSNNGSMTGTRQTKGKQGKSRASQSSGTMSGRA